MHLALTAVLAAAALAGTVAAQGRCFVPNGTNRHDLTNIKDNKYEPCEGNGHSMCCNTVTGDKCQPNGLCWNEGAKLLWRESCSDPTWQSPKCLKLCVSDDKLDNGDPMSGSDVVVTECGDGSYCCGNDKKASDCCTAGKGVRIVDGQVVNASSTATTSAAPTSTSASPATSSPSDGSGSSSSNAGVIGGAVGGSLGAVALALAAGFFWYRRRRRGGSQEEPAPARQDEYAEGETKYRNIPYGEPAPAPQYPPSELPVDQRPAELGGEPLPPR